MVPRLAITQHFESCDGGFPAQFASARSKQLCERPGLLGDIPDSRRQCFDQGRKRISARVLLSQLPSLGVDPVNYAVNLWSGQSSF